jgi:hypothetical protein
MAVSSFTLSQSTIVGGQIAGGTLTLSAPAPVGGEFIFINSADSATGTPLAQVYFAAGSTSETFSFPTDTVSQSNVLSLFAGGQSVSLTLLPYSADSPQSTGPGRVAQGAVGIARPQSVWPIDTGNLSYGSIRSSMSQGVLQQSGGSGSEGPVTPNPNASTTGLSGTATALQRLNILNAGTSPSPAPPE